MKDRDSLYRFLFENLAVRGFAVHLDAAWLSVLERQAYPPPISRVLGEAMAAAALLSSTIKFDGLLTLQIQGQGLLPLLVAQCASERTLRAAARWQGAAPEQAPLSALCENGSLAITIDAGHGSDPYQGIVGLSGDSLATALERYFEHSEQIPTRFWLAADNDRAAGLLLQRLPGATTDLDAWNRIEHLGATLTEPELLTLPIPELLRRLFREETVRLFEPDSVAFRCTCSRQRIAAMLRSLGPEEVRDILAEQDRIGVSCEFCGSEYEFDAVDVESALADAVPFEASQTRH